ncbi:MAG: alpha/beta hydrolase [Roseibacillus sp.]|nr:alpha/beta hydrolase [Roseibacillus sp.]
MKLPSIVIGLIVLPVIGVLSAAPKRAESEPITVPLWLDGKAPNGDGTFDSENAVITVHRPAKPNGAAIVICPGGGYGGVVIGPEGHGIAKWLNEHGITGVVLRYRLPRGRASVPLLDVQQALRIVRARGPKEWGCDPSRLGVMGFSAGGHLASTAVTHFDEGDPQASSPVGRASSRPDFGILIYPVITMGAGTHGGSRRNLLGAAPPEDLVELYSNEKQVTQNTSPCYLAHAKDDGPVPPLNSRLFHEVLKSAGVESEYLELPTGGHGLNGYKGPMWEAWQKGVLTWMRRIKVLSGV